MRREDRRAADPFECGVGRGAALHERSGTLDREERRVALVDVEDARVDPERGERTHAADAEQELLADPVLAVAGIERVGEQVHVEEIQRDGRRTAGADVVAPYRGGHGLAGELDLDIDGLAHEPERLRVERLVGLRLAALGREALGEVAAAIEEPDADERDPELRGGLQVVAREHPKPAGVDREARLEAELHAEVRDEQLAAAVTVRLRPPGREIGSRLGRLHASPSQGIE